MSRSVRSTVVAMADSLAPNEKAGNRGTAMRVKVIRHHAEDSPGFIGAAFEARGAEITTHLFPAEGPLPPIDDADHLIVLGAIPSVYDDGPARTWIEDELAWLRRADEAGRPVLGICFGAQALCAALGGRVEPAARKEVGWTMIDSYDPALIPPGPWLVFHEDRCLPSPRAKILAATSSRCRRSRSGGTWRCSFTPRSTAPSSGCGSTRAGGRRPCGRARTPTRCSPRPWPRSLPPRPAPTPWSRPRSCWPRGPTPPSRPPRREHGFVVTEGCPGTFPATNPRTARRAAVSCLRP